ncbi:Crp/Fnr family transcriptional regulator [Bradyrhizobium sp. ISRA464]|uniref:Crp/Fnr family transcriptional regulator n=2 Tax=Bradyrhizobium TaxID=374 RepID=UPI002479540F|nr:Crp/Fnr family transcriptional regulator [Bradyrhizobium sp. ISRA464]WGS25855.1 Crp/Fnr family transcriptional regulator [Bradyrhizobium sp. ISRA464]
MTDHVSAVVDAPAGSRNAARKPVYGAWPMPHRPFATRKKRPFVENAILTSLPLRDRTAIGKCLEPIVLKERMILQEPKGHVEHVYFIDSGLISLRVAAGGSMLETAVVGYRGLVGGSFLWGGRRSTHQSVVLFHGRARRIPVEDLRRVIKGRPVIRDRLFEYVQALTFQCVQTGLCGVRHNREQRLASWLCLASDAAEARMLPVTRDYLSNVLGLGRAGVTETLIRFEEQGLIRKIRGFLQIDERKKLEQKACCCYKLVSSAYVSCQSAISAEEPVG